MLELISAPWQIAGSLPQWREDVRQAVVIDFLHQGQRAAHLTWRGSFALGANPLRLLPGRSAMTRLLCMPYGISRVTSNSRSLELNHFFLAR